jgi:DNA-binding response OmpR family regulator
LLWNHDSGLLKTQAAVISSQPQIQPSQSAPQAVVRRRILVVEDDIDSARSLTWILRDMGHEVEYAINGYVAVDIAAQFLPEFVFLDLALPGMNGFEVCRRLKRQAGLERTRVIAVTAYGHDEYRQRSREAGCEGYIVKPLDPGMLNDLLA